MKKVIIIGMLIFGASACNVAYANDYNKAVLGHVVQSTMNGTNVDASKLMEQEMQKLAHNFAIEMTGVLQQYLPSILDGIAAELRMKSDLQYKCALLKDTKIEDKECTNL